MLLLLQPAVLMDVPVASQLSFGGSTGEKRGSSLLCPTIIAGMWRHHPHHHHAHHTQSRNTEFDSSVFFQSVAPM